MNIANKQLWKIRFSGVGGLEEVHVWADTLSEALAIVEHIFVEEYPKIDSVMLYFEDVFGDRK